MDENTLPRDPEWINAMSATASKPPAFADAVTQRIVRFLVEIGLEVRAETIEEETFLPGILIQDGVILVDEARLTHPGDLLHEAGHLATVTPKKRRRMGAYAGIKAHEDDSLAARSGPTDVTTPVSNPKRPTRGCRPSRNKRREHLGVGYRVSPAPEQAARTP